MGRSVSTHSNAVASVYLRPGFEEGDYFAWSDFIDDLRDNVLTEKYPSLTKCDRWDSRENHVILENSQIEISVSEYCGVVAICLAPLNDYHKQEFNQAIAERLAAGFEKHLNKSFKSSALQSLGRASNGEQVFNRV